MELTAVFLLFSAAVPGVCRRGHLRPVPGGEGGIASSGPGGETQDPDVSAGHPQPSRDPRGDV